MSISIKAFQDGSEYQSDLQRREGQNEGREAFFASNLRTGTDKHNLLEQKRQMAQKQAFQLIGNAWKMIRKQRKG